MSERAPKLMINQSLCSLRRFSPFNDHQLDTNTKTQLRSLTVSQQNHVALHQQLAIDENQLIRKNESIECERVLLGLLPDNSVLHEVANGGAIVDKQDSGSLTSTMTNSTVANNKFMSSTTSSLMVRKGSYDLAQASKCINYSYSSSHLPNDDVNNKRLTLLNEHDANNCDSVIGRCYKSQPNNDGEVEEQRQTNKSATSNSGDVNNNNNKQISINNNNVISNNKCNIQQQPTILSMKSLAEYINSNKIEDELNSMRCDNVTGVSTDKLRKSSKKESKQLRQANELTTDASSFEIEASLLERYYHEPKQPLQPQQDHAYATAIMTDTNEQQQKFNCICQFNNNCLYNIAPNLLPPLHLHSMLEPYSPPTIALPFDGPPPSNAIRIDATKLIPIADESLTKHHNHPNNTNHLNKASPPNNKHKKQSTNKKRGTHQATSIGEIHPTLDSLPIKHIITPPRTIIASVDHVIEDVLEDEQRQSLTNNNNNKTTPFETTIDLQSKQQANDDARNSNKQQTSSLTNQEGDIEQQLPVKQQPTTRRYQPIDQLTANMQHCSSSQAQLLSLPQSQRSHDTNGQLDHNYNNAFYFYAAPRSINHHQLYTMQQTPYLPAHWTAHHYHNNKNHHYYPNNLIQQQQHHFNSSRATTMPAAVDLIMNMQHKYNNNNNNSVNGKQIPSKSKGARLFGALPGLGVRMQNNRLLQENNATDTNKTTTTNKISPPPTQPIPRPLNKVAPNIMFHHPTTIMQPYHHAHNYLFNHNQHILPMGEQHQHHHNSVKSQLNRKQLKRLQRDNLIWVHRDKQRERKVCIGTVSLALIVLLASILFAIFAIMQFHSTSIVRPLLT